MRIRHGLIQFVILLLLIGLQVFSTCSEEPFRQGRNLYTQHCANCHMEDGSGLGELIPPLAQADWLRDHPLETACIIQHGMEGEVVVNGVTYSNPMPGVESLSDFQIANIINYINQAWGNDYGYVKLADIRETLEGCAH